MFFDSWQALLRVLVVGALAYVALVLSLRISGKRTLSKMNAFDLVVTVALGSTLATVLLSKDVALVEGIAAFVVLICAQWVVAWSSLRSRWFQRVVKAQPALLFYEGRFDDTAMRRERVTRVELESAIRNQGFGSLAEVAAVVLETDGTFSVLESVDRSSRTALSNVRGFDHAARGALRRQALSRA